MRGSVTIFSLALMLAAANAMADEGEGTAGAEAVESTQETRRQRQDRGPVGRF